MKKLAKSNLQHVSGGAVAVTVAPMVKIFNAICTIGSFVTGFTIVTSAAFLLTAPVLFAFSASRWR